MIRPLKQFCCGCSLSFGVQLIILLALIQNIYYIGTTTSNIAFEIRMHGLYSSVNLAMRWPMETLLYAFRLFGFPYFAAAIWGLRYQQEAYLRLYLCYMIMDIIFDMTSIFPFFLTDDSCGSKQLARIYNFAYNFACDTREVRLLTLTIVPTMFINLYMLLTIWSLCKEMKKGASGALDGPERARRANLWIRFEQHFSPNYGIA